MTTRKTMKTDSAVTAIDHDRGTVELVRRLAVARKAIASWREEEDHVRELLVKTFGADHVGVWEATVEKHPILKIAVRESHRFDQSAFRDDHPDLYETYKTVSQVATVTVDARVIRQ